jgi:hypothetical protein
MSSEREDMLRRPIFTSWRLSSSLYYTPPLLVTPICRGRSRHDNAAMPPSARLEGLLAGLSQGNALELEFIDQLKEGLDSIAEGMRNECYNRSDALSEVREKLEVVPANVPPEL